MPPDNDHRSRAFLVGLEIERPGIDDRVLNWRHLLSMMTRDDGTVWLHPTVLTAPPYTGNWRSNYYSSLSNIKINRARRRKRRRSGGV